jgi:predicted nucleic acid-binding protein
LSNATTERLRVFIDSDVLNAGAASTEGAGHLNLQLAELGLVDAFISEQVRSEVTRNLAKKLPSALANMRTLIDASCEVVQEPAIDAIASIREQGLADYKDAPILAAALAANCSWLVTFNVRHFHAGQELQVGTPGEFIGRLRELLLGLTER